VLARDEAEIGVLDRLAIDAHGALTDQPPRFAVRRRELELLHQLANPDVLRDAKGGNIRRYLAPLKLALEVCARRLRRVRTVILLDDHRGQALLRLHRMKAP